MIVVPCAGISIAYFMAGKSKPVTIRIMKSSHGLMIVAAYYFSMFTSKYTVPPGNPKPWEITFEVLLALAGISAVLSLIKYIDWKWHFLYLIVGPIGCLVWLAGSLTIWHDSL